MRVGSQTLVDKVLLSDAIFRKVCVKRFAHIERAIAREQS
jgi:hypothetical protein